ncbi:MAG: YdcF family protein [Acidobacteria bacterium]|nr:YdcF family protein [Acidobacteriota bacterium]
MTFWFVLTHKILPLLVMPLGLALVLIAWGAIRRSRGAMIAAGGILCLGSTPVTGESALRYLESRYPRLRIESAPSADAVVVLGGFASEDEGADIEAWNDAVDRFEAGLAFYRGGRAPLLVLSAGAPKGPDAETQGAWLRRLAESRGIPSESVLVFGNAVNTAAEARMIRELRDRYGWTRILLVTSAFHMPRSVLLFEGQGLSVIPAPVDHRAGDCGLNAPSLSLSCFIPDVDSLARCQISIRELIGYAVYWISDFVT